MIKGGFTIIELILTMSLLSVIALLLFSYSGNIGDVSVDGASWKIQADIRYAQQLATSTEVPHGVLFTQGTQYTVYKEAVDNPVSDPLDRQPMVKTVEDFGELEIAAPFQVEFDSLGRPTMGGGGYVELQADNGASRKIHVIDNTGAVVVDVLNLGSSCGCRVCSEWGARR